MSTDLCTTCVVAQSEVGALVPDAADIPDGGYASVVSIVLRTKVLQFKDLCLALKYKRIYLE